MFALRVLPPVRSSRRVVWALGLCVALAFCAQPGVAVAQCAVVDGGVDNSLAGTLQDTFPADQDVAVPTDAVVRLRYYIQAPTPPVLCVTTGSSASCLPGRSSVVGAEVVWVGDALLSPETLYSASFSDSSGQMYRIGFSTGAGSTAGPPDFAGITSATLDQAGTATVLCDPGGVDVTVNFDRVPPPDPSVSTTPWPGIDVEYVVYETRGPNISGPRERDRARLENSGSTLDSSAQRTIHLSAADASGPVCFNVQALDPLGRSNGNTQEQCIDPTQGNYFAGCDVSPSSPRSVLLSLAAGALVFAFRGRRLRRQACRRIP